MNIETVLKHPDGSVKALDINNLLDSVAERSELLQQIAKKIRYEGTLELIGVDLDEVVRAYQQGYIELPEVNEKLYAGRQSASTAEKMISELRSLNFQVINVRSNHHTYYIRAKRCLR
jgi:hypothetical protein